MNKRNLAACVVVLAVSVAGARLPAHALGTAFTYQGQLQQSGSAATGPCDFQISLWDAGGSGAPPAGGNQVGGVQTLSGAGVTDGLFTLPLDFGADAFSTGSDRWLQIAVRCPAGGGSYQTLAPRQPLTPAPFALFASTVAEGSVSTTKLAPGAVTTSQLATNAVTSAQIADGTITMNDLANGAVSTTKIGDGQVTAAKLVAPLSLTTTAGHSFVGAFDGTSTGLNSVGVSGTANNGPNAYGLYGLATAGYGVVGSSTTGTGAVGQSASGVGVQGSSNNGVGVLGQGVDDAGVEGTSNQVGVLGETTGDGGIGVRGRAGTGAGATGVEGDSTNGPGVRGESDNGPGVSGTSDNGDDGVFGASGKENGTGVHGIANTGVAAHGVFGESASGVGVYGESTDAYGVAGRGSIGMFGIAATTHGTGVFGVTKLEGDDADDAYALYGAATKGVGVRGESIMGVGVSAMSTSGIGMSGESTSNVGVRGESTGASGVFGTSAKFIGVYGRSQALSTLTIAGVVGEAAGNNGIGVRGVANTGSNAWAVNGESTTGYAGYFSGKVNVTGTLTAGVKPFKIDHPLNPTNQYLMHAAVESSDMKNIYDGIAVLDDAGTAVIELPVWFEALNRDFRYQLTCIGGVASVYIAEEVSDHHFRIAGGVPGLKVSWQVTGIRKDAFANAHPLVVELDKPTEERGRYLYPVEAGMPASLSVDRAKQAVAQAQLQ
ncbi:MAG TPA: hypothetical protein VMW56_00820 [Candidatus Margulisiibacteriota bacterium]|nr:hypothetical protein [Candidatus Margulisiibacteriota bacterium]